MIITDVRVKVIPDPDPEMDKLVGFSTIAIDDCLVIHDLKLIRLSTGLFVSMPSRKFMDRCHSCSKKNAVVANFCSWCGVGLAPDRAVRDRDGRLKIHTDVAHPINNDCRNMIQRTVISEYERELARSKEPGYECRYDCY